VFGLLAEMERKWPSSTSSALFDEMLEIISSLHVSGLGATTERIASPEPREECRGLASIEQQPGFALFARRDDQPGRSDADRADLNSLDGDRAQLELPLVERSSSRAPSSDPYRRPKQHPG
jgi:hypothetical protein